MIVYNSMAKIGYIFIATDSEKYSKDRTWMQQYDCVRVIKEMFEPERLRPMRKQLISSLKRGDESKWSESCNVSCGSPKNGSFSRILPYESDTHHSYLRPHRHFRTSVAKHQAFARTAHDYFSHKRMHGSSQCHSSHHPSLA